MGKLVSKTYGDALFGLAKDESRIDEFYMQAQEIVKIFSENPEISKLLDQPKVSKADKVTFVEDIFMNIVSKEVIGLMVLLVEKSHYAEIVAVFNYFIEQVKEEKGIGVAIVTTAFALSNEQVSSIEQKLLASTKYQEFEMKYEVDQAIIGGMIIRIGDRVVDSSIKTKLYNLSKELKNIQLTI